MTSVHSSLNTKLICPTCNQEMAITRSIVNDDYSVTAVCNKCYRSVDMTPKRNTMKKIDKTQKVMRVRIPKLRDEFYIVESNDGTTKRYNPVSRVMHIETLVDSDIEHNKLLDKIMTEIMRNNDAPQG